MTDPRPWPNNAKEARDLAAEEALTGRNAIEHLLNQECSPEETIRRLAIATISFHKILRLLESVGAQTSPLYDQQYPFNRLDSINLQIKFETKKE
jgi:hypothetical protein